MTLKTFLLCSLFSVQFALNGQTLSGEREGQEEENLLPPRAWYFAYENLEKAVTGDPSASARFIALNGPWKFSDDNEQPGAAFYTMEFDDSSWKTVAMPREKAADSGGAIPDAGGGAGINPGNRTAGPGSAGALLYRNKFSLKEDVALGKEVFMSLSFPASVTFWVNGRPAGSVTAAFPGAEFNISAFVQPGENLLALKVEPGTPAKNIGNSPGVHAEREPGNITERGTGNIPQSSREAKLLPGVGSVLLYVRPETHFKDIALVSTLDNSKKKGLLELRLQVENRMDSVRERFWGVLREPLYSTVTVKAELIDDKGNKIIDFNKENTRKVRGGDSVVFHFNGTVNDVKPWTHEKPDRYRLNIRLLDAAGNVLEAVSRQIGFRTINLTEGKLVVNGVRVPLRIFEPASRPAYGLDREQLMQDIREIKRGNFNAVYAAPYLTYRSWYELCNRYGVYILDRGTHRNRNNPSVIPVRGAKELPEAEMEAVVLHLGDFFKGTVRVVNRFAFRDLSGYYLEWAILRNGKKEEEGRVQDLHAQPGEEAALSLGYKMRFYKGNDYFLNLRVKTKAGTDLVPAGFTIASRQFRLSPYQYEEEYHVDKGLIDVTDGPGSIALNGYDFRIVFDKSTGQIIRYSYKGKELMNNGPELNFPEVHSGEEVPGRNAPAENAQDEDAPYENASGEDSLEESQSLWSEAVRKSSLLEYKVTEDVNGNYYLSFTKVLLGGDARLFQKFRIDGRGAILVENVFVKMEGDHPLMPRFGTRFELPGEFREITWYGREPAAQNEVGIYSGEITDNAGTGKSGVRWVRLTRGDGYGLLIRKEDELFHLTAVREGAAADSPVVLSIDLTQKPVPFKSRNFTYRIIPYVPTTAVQ